MALRGLVLLISVLVAACDGPQDGPGDPRTQSWSEITATARGQRLTMHMWMGDPAINAYMSGYVVPQLAERFDIALELVGNQGNGIVSLLMAETEADRGRSDADIVWINGETSYQLRRIGALFGPFTDQLPNNRLIRWSDPTVAVDFQQPVAGMEAPWGTVQFILIYDSDRLRDPPRNRAELTAWIQANPGRFTLPTGFTGMTFLKTFLIEFAGGPDGLAGPFDEEKYKVASDPLFEWLSEIQPYFWRDGRTFPNTLAQLHQMFVNGEVDFTMSNRDGEVANKRLAQVFPASARALVFDEGTIRNTHYLGIPARSGHKAAAMVAIDFLLSPEAQLQKQKPMIWGDGTVLDIAMLDQAMQLEFHEARNAPGMPNSDRLRRKALQEPAPEYMIRLYEDFRHRIIKGPPN